MRQLVSFAILVTLIIIIAFYEIIADFIVLIGYILVVTLGAMALITVVYGTLMAVERWRLARVGRIEAKKNADTLIVANEHGVFIRERDTKAVWLSLHQMPQWRVNGQPQEPTEAELLTFQAFLASRHAQAVTAAPQVPLLTAGGEAAPLPDLLPILDRAQRVLIIGASDSGKTNLLQWVVARRTGSIIVIDPHAAPGKWPNAKVVGIGSNFAEIEVTLDNLIELMVRRYKEIGQGLVREGEHPRLTIIIDEWMSIAYQCRNAHDVLVRLLTESRKAAFSVIIGSHSERVRSLGLDGKGDLKDGFLFVRLWLESNGDRRATYDNGRGELPCLLPGRFTLPQENNLIEIEAITQPVEVEEPKRLVDTERVLELFDNEGYTTLTAICTRLFGYKKADLVSAIRDILVDNGRLG